MSLIVLDKFFRNLALLFLGAYRTAFTQFFGGNCRFYPSCSQYAVECFNEHNALNASKLTIIRLCKCRPGGPHGWDPVPKRKNYE